MWWISIVFLVFGAIVEISNSVLFAQKYILRKNISASGIPFLGGIFLAVGVTTFPGISADRGLYAVAILLVDPWCVPLIFMIVVSSFLGFLEGKRQVKFNIDEHIICLSKDHIVLYSSHKQAKEGWSFDELVNSPYTMYSFDGGVVDARRSLSENDGQPEIIFVHLPPTAESIGELVRCLSNWMSLSFDEPRQWSWGDFGDGEKVIKEIIEKMK